jgi:hypothetical protein
MTALASAAILCAVVAAILGYIGGGYAAVAIGMLGLGAAGFALSQERLPLTYAAAAIALVGLAVPVASFFVVL